MRRPRRVDDVVARIQVNLTPTGSHSKQTPRSRAAAELVCRPARLEAEAKARHLRLLFLDTSTGAGGAVDFYRALGSTLAGNIPDCAADPDDRLVPDAIFYKRLGGENRGVPSSGAPAPDEIGVAPDAAIFDWKTMSRPLIAAIYACKIAGLAVFFLTARWPLAAGLFFGPDIFLFYQVFVPSAGIMCRVRRRFRTTVRAVWLTIDDGPDPQDTPRILELLERHNARATFFLIGIRAARHPELVVEILRRGHGIGCHTHTHPADSFWCATPRRVRQEIDEALLALAPADATVRWFRAPAGIKNFFLSRALAERGLSCVGWSVRSYDSLARRPEAAAARVLRRVRAGDVIVMHEGPSLRQNVRVTAIGLVLQGLSERGFACVLPSADTLF